MRKMNMHTIECKYCDCKVSYMPCANFIVFCPECKREIFLECEYGYGPVTPCSIFLGEDSIGTVTANNKNEYLLKIESDNQQIKLKESYLEALHEASKIMRKILIPTTKNKDLNSFKIRKQGGSLCFFGDWFGKPWDNFHRIKNYSYQDDVLEIVFDEWERLLVFEPLGMINTDKEFSIKQAKMVKLSWYSYNNSEKELNKISYELIDGSVYKISKYGREHLERKEPYFSVLLG
ncbi:hypothetical protein [Kineothrix alysoides]|nr:hypothetical protein [Kineothrix alysoides]